MKHFLLFLLALMASIYLQAQEQLPDASLFEACRHIEDNDTLFCRLYRSQKADTTTKALPCVIFLHGVEALHQLFLGRHGNKPLSFSVDGSAVPKRQALGKHRLELA